MLNVAIVVGAFTHFTVSEKKFQILKIKLNKIKIAC